MKPHPAVPLALAALCLAVALPASTLPAFAQSDNTSPSQSGAPMHGMHEAMRMVPARAALDRTLDADKDHPGEQFRATLAQKVQLDNGPELPAGTILIGRVSTDDMNESGPSKLALRFTHALLKDGQDVPIKATIVGVAGPEATDAEGYPVSPGDQAPNSWNDGTLAVDQISVLSGVDLHSKIASRNSGVFVSHTKHNMKLISGTELELAIAEQHHPHMHPMNGMNDNGQQ